MMSTKFPILKWKWRNVKQLESIPKGGSSPLEWGFLGRFNTRICSSHWFACLFTIADHWYDMTDSTYPQWLLESVNQNVVIFADLISAIDGLKGFLKYSYLSIPRSVTFLEVFSSIRTNNLVILFKFSPQKSCWYFGINILWKPFIWLQKYYFFNQPHWMNCSKFYFIILLSWRALSKKYLENNHQYQDFH